jgi:hypothetical protein
MEPTTTSELPTWTPLNEPATAFAAGMLALVAGLAAAFASTMAAPLFAAMLAVGLGARGAVAVVWFAVLPALAERPLQAIAIAAALALCAAGTAWLEEAWLEHTKRRAGLARSVPRPSVRYFELHRA